MMVVVEGSVLEHFYYKPNSDLVVLSNLAIWLTIYVCTQALTKMQDFLTERLLGGGFWRKEMRIVFRGWLRRQHNKTKNTKR